MLTLAQSVGVGAGDGISERLLDYGVGGVAILALGIAVIVLYRRVLDLQDKRTDDMKAVSERYHDALRENTRALEDLARAFERRGGA